MKLILNLDVTRRHTCEVAVSSPPHWSEDQIWAELDKANGEETVSGYVAELKRRGFVCSEDYVMDKPWSSAVEWSDYQIISEEKMGELPEVSPRISEKDIVIGRTFTLNWHGQERITVKVVKSYVTIVGEEKSIYVELADGQNKRFYMDSFIDLYNTYGLGFVDEEEEENQ